MLCLDFDSRAGRAETKSICSGGKHHPLCLVELSKSIFSLTLLLVVVAWEVPRSGLYPASDGKPSEALFTLKKSKNINSNMENVYQFKITLLERKPIIWRRIQVPEGYNFGELHVAIQDAMGWQSCHMHQFEMFSPKTGEYVYIGPQDDMGILDRLIPQRNAKIAEYFLSSKYNKARYEYDMGDSWQHEIFLEKIIPSIPGMEYPKCLNGKLACPPEDCGGVSGYDHLLEIIANPQHEEYDEMMEWLGGSFDPTHFDPDSVDFHGAEYL